MSRTNKRARCDIKYTSKMRASVRYGAVALVIELHPFQVTSNASIRNTAYDNFPCNTLTLIS